MFPSPTCPFRSAPRTILSCFGTLSIKPFRSCLSDSTNEVFDQNSLFLNCIYYDTISLSSQILNRSNINNLFFIHFNIRSLQKNIDKLTHYISQFYKLPDLKAITETKLQNNTIYNNIDIAGYNFIHADSLTKAGGVGFYINNLLSYTVEPEYDLNLNFVGNIWIQVDTDKNSILHCNWCYLLSSCKHC